jgi:hypothetical protein
MARRPPADTPERWTRRRVAGLSVRAATLGVPFGFGLGTIVLLGGVVPAPGGALGVARNVAILALSWLVMALVHRALHRLLPLAALLEMSLVFPDHAPSRLQLARRVASRRDLDDLLAGRTADAHESTQEAAERILALVGALSEHDRGTRGHSERVRVLSDLIAARMGLSERDRDRLRWAALLHDIGKLQVPAVILNKPARPSAREWEVLRRHPDHGDQMVAPLRSWLGGWGDVVVQHHEKWDGSGYPYGLSGAQICLGARIVAVADAFDVMTAVRAYKKAVGRAAALRELVAHSGTQFDPAVVRALITVPQQRVLFAMGPAAWLTGLPFLGQGQMAMAGALTGKAGMAVGAVALTGTAVLTPLEGSLPVPVPVPVPVGARVDQARHLDAEGATSQATSGATSGATSQATSGATSGATSQATSGAASAAASGAPTSGGRVEPTRSPGSGLTGGRSAPTRSPLPSPRTGASAAASTAARSTASGLGSRTSPSLRNRVTTSATSPATVRKRVRHRVRSVRRTRHGASRSRIRYTGRYTAR